MTTANMQNPLLARTTCSSLLQDLQGIWDEVGETDGDRDKMLLQLEQECLDVYKRKVDQASKSKARLYLQLAESETELANLASALGERSFFNRPDKQMGTLKDQLAAIAPALDELRQKKEARMKQFMDVQVQILRICGEIAGNLQLDDPVSTPKLDERDLSVKKLDEFHSQLQELHKEKNRRLQKVIDHVNTVHEISAVLATDFLKIITEVHPSLDDSVSNQLKNISNGTLARLAQTVQSLKEEKQMRLQKLQELATALIELWNLMDTPMEERKSFDHVTSYISASVDEIREPGELALEIIEKTEVEVERLDQLKASKMKELVLKKQLELEEIYRHAHIAVDGKSAQERLTDIIDSGTVDLCELLSSMDDQIAKAKEEALSRKEIMDKMEKWMASCEEENWLEDYNRDQNRYNAGRGAHKNLKRAEKARLIVAKIPSLVDTLMAKTRAWEEERGMPFVYDGVPLLETLDDYASSRQQREEEKRKQRDQKRLQEQMVTEQETLFGSKPSPARLLTSKKIVGQRGNGSNVSVTPGRRQSVTPVRPGISISKDGKKEHLKVVVPPANYVALPKDDTFSQFSENDSTASSP